MDDRNIEFEKLKERLIAFNRSEQEKGDKNSSTLVHKIDYEYIYNLKNIEYDDVDLISGTNIKRSITNEELKDLLHEYAKDTFNVRISRVNTFDKMVTILTEEVAKINEEEAGYKPQNINPNDTKFSSNDLLYTYEILSGSINSVSTRKPNPESIRVLKDATINIDESMNTDKIIELSEQEIENIIDPNFKMGC